METEQTPTRLLVVDDEESQRTALAGMIALWGYTVETAANGQEALDKLASFPANVIVTDLMMPRMSGTELAAHLRARGHDLPVIYSSGYPRDVLLDDQPDDRTIVLSKPFTGEELSSAVHGLLAGAAGTSAES